MSLFNVYEWWECGSCLPANTKLLFDRFTTSLINENCAHLFSLLWGLLLYLQVIIRSIICVPKWSESSCSEQPSDQNLFLYHSCVFKGLRRAGGEWICWRRRLYPLLWRLDHRQQLPTRRSVLLQRPVLQKEHPHPEWEERTYCHTRPVQAGGQQRSWCLLCDHPEADEGRCRDVQLWRGEDH